LLPDPSLFELASIFDHKHVGAYLDELTFGPVPAHVDAYYEQPIFDYVILQVLRVDQLVAILPHYPVYFPRLSMNLGLDNWTMAILHGFHFDSWTRPAAGNPLHTDYPLTWNGSF